MRRSASSASAGTQPSPRLAILLRTRANHAPVAVVLAREPDVEASNLGREIPARPGVRLAGEHADRNLESRELRALELDRVDARDQLERGMRDEIRVQQRPDFRGIATARVVVIVGDESPEFRSIARLGGELRFGDKITDRVLGRTGGSAAGNGESRRQCETGLMQGGSPTAGDRR
jgi:hypothetical protein